MKRYYVIGIVLCPFIFMSCEGISNSIKETFKKEVKEGKKLDTTNDISISQENNLKEEISKEGTQAHAKLTNTNGNINENDFLTDSITLELAEKKLRALPQFAGKKIMLYNDIHFYDNGRVMTSIQHPDNPEYIDKYEYENGIWGEPKPVQISVRTDVESKLFDLDQMRFATVAKIIKTYNEKASTLEGAKLASHAYGIFSGGTLIWYPRTIDGSRQKYAIEFYKDGVLKSYKRE